FIVTEDNEPQTITQIAFQRVESSEAPLPPVTTPPPPPRAAGAAPAVQPTITGSATGDIKYRDRRLLVLYFDLSSMPPPDQMRAYTAARKFLAEQIRPQDLVAILTFQNGAVRVKTDFTGDRAALQEIIETLIYGESRDANDLADQETDVGTAFGQDDAEFN